MKIVSYDLETTDLRANMGIILCASFQEIVPPGYYGNHHDTPPRPYTLKLDFDKVDRYDPNPDKQLAVAIKQELLKYNCAVGGTVRRSTGPSSIAASPNTVSHPGTRNSTST